MRLNCLILAGLAVIALPASSRGATVRVPAEQPTIQAAIDAAHAGDTVLVAPGEFVITRPITFRGKAIVVRSEKGPDATSVRMAERPDPDAACGCVALFDGGETAEARLEGFTLTGGHGGFWLPREHGSGGGIYCSDSSPTLANLRITENRASTGGGISCHRGSSPLVIDCSITGNQAGFTGGGGIYCGEGSSPTLLRCVIAGNYGRHNGGGVFCEGSSPSLVNCLIVENQGKDFGGGIYCESGSSPRLMNCTLEKNRSVRPEDDIFCLGSSPVVTNCIVTSIYADKTSSPAVTYTLLRSPFLGTGNLFADPLFACDGDYHLRPDSPAVDAGIADGAPASDLENRERPCGGKIDLGAYEHCLGTTAPVCFLRGNADADASFDISDAINILGFLFLGGEEPHCLDSADANDDGRVDLTDGVSVLAQLFLGDPAPPPPFEKCGTDPTPDALSCRFFGLCQ